MEALTSSCPPRFRSLSHALVIWFLVSFLSRYPFLLILVVSLNLSFWGLLSYIKTCKDTWESFPPSGLARFNSSTKIHSFEEFWEIPILLDGFWDCLRFVGFWVLMLWRYLLNTPWNIPAKFQVNPSWFGWVLDLKSNFPEICSYIPDMSGRHLGHAR